MTGKKKRTASSQRWLKRQEKDEYTQRAYQEGYRSRAVYKLLEIQQKDTIIERGMCVIDLGAAPGSWSQLAVKYVGPQGKVFALDILPIEPIPEVDRIQGDFRDPTVVDTLKKEVGDRPIGLVISDMAPNLSGIGSVDQPRSLVLAELALELAQELLVDGGSMVTKVFQGEGFDSYLASVRECFRKVVIRKPKASRSESREVYVVAKNFGLKV